MERNVPPQPYNDVAEDESKISQSSDIWTSPLPSRKRDMRFLETQSHTRNKSQRTTPSPEGRPGRSTTSFPLSLPDDDALEIIDLTG